MSDTIADAERLHAIVRENRSYARYVYTFFAFTLSSLLRQRRVVLGALVTLIPVVIPVSMSFFSASEFREAGGPVFVKMMELLYLKAIVPLLALFFGCMLIGEDVESQTMPFMLTRPMPRSAYVLGRFVAYCVITAAVLAPSIALTFAGAAALADFSVSRANLMLMLHYDMIALLGLMAYGALFMFLGTVTKRPIVIGVIFLIPWQRFALMIPGYIDFFTIEKYLNIMLPVLPAQRGTEVARQALAGITKDEILISATTAALTLVGITVFFLVLTQLAVRWREFSQAKAIGG
jgi:ABC-type transport system involved in multi-copper enzyme maturation permease subunit